MGIIFYDPKILRKFRKLTLIVVRTNKLMELSNSKPCQNCLKLLTNFGIQEIIYSSGDNNIYNKRKIKNIKSACISKGGIWLNQNKK